jgi:hypothetical protein
MFKADDALHTLLELEIEREATNCALRLGDEIQILPGTRRKHALTVKDMTADHATRLA